METCCGYCKGWRHVVGSVRDGDMLLLLQGMETCYGNCKGWRHVVATVRDGDMLCLL